MLSLLLARRGVVGLGALSARHAPLSARHAPLSTAAAAPFWTHEKRIHAIEEAFHGKVAVSVDDFATGVSEVLADHGFSRENTLLGISTCPDEVNRDLDLALMQKYGPCFNFGGLAGIPFAGKTGFGAYTAHIPDGDGRLLVVSTAHVGVTSSGVFGDLSRVHMECETTSCGAAIAALSALQATNGEYTHPADPLDYQQGEVVNIVKKRFAEISGSNDPMSALSGAIADEIGARLRAILPETITHPVVHVNGVLVNTEPGQEDLFVPVQMVSYQVGETAEGGLDLLPELEAHLRRRIRAHKMETMMEQQEAARDRTQQQFAPPSPQHATGDADADANSDADNSNDVMGSSATGSSR